MEEGAEKGLIVILIILVSVTFIGCARPIELTETTGGVRPPTDESVRPDIPRTTPGEDDETPLEQPREGQNGSIFLPIITSSTDLDIPLGDTIGQHFPIITRREFPLLRGDPVRVHQNLVVGYEQLLKFDFGNKSTGKIVFQRDPRTEEIGTFLLFERDKPIFEYTLRLREGTFYDFQGRYIQIMGGTYVIAEANNHTVILYGIDVPNNFVFTNDEQIKVNSSKQPGTVVKVTPDSMSYQLFARGRDDGSSILLGAGESLADNIPKTRLASPLLDIRYLGAANQSITPIEIERTRFGYSLKAMLTTGSHTIPLVEDDAGRVTLGRFGEQYHFKECSSSSDYCIAEDDRIVFTSSEGRTYVLRYSSSHVKPNQVVLRDMFSNEYIYEFLGTPGTDAKTDIIFGNDRFRDAFTVFIGPYDNISKTYNISVDQNENGYVSGERIDVVVQDGTVIRVGDAAAATDPSTNATRNTTVPLEFRIPWQRTTEAYRNSYNYGQDQVQQLNLVFRNSEWSIDVPGVTFYRDDETEERIGSTPFGMTFIKDEEDLLILSPLTQAYGVVKLEESTD